MKRHQVAIYSGLPLIALAAAIFIRFRPHADAQRLSPPLERGSIVESVYGIGTITANRSYQLKSGVADTIRDIYVKEGDRVKRGQRLVRLEGTGLLSAPFEGTVTSLPMKEGETVFAQSDILDVVDLRDRYAIVSVEQRAAVRVRSGQGAKLSFENMRDRAYDGTVESVYSNEGAFLVRINVPQLPDAILPGMTADVAIIVGQKSGALLVPVAAIDNGKVRARRGSRTITVAIHTGIIDSAMAELASGDLREGDRLILGESK